MNNTNPFSNLNFRVRPQTIPAQWIAIGIAFVLFTILWNAVPESALYWLLLPIILCLTWIASFAWRQAVKTLRDYLSSLLEK